MEREIRKGEKDKSNLWVNSKHLTFPKTLKLFLCTVYSLNFIDFGKHFRKFSILSGSGDREMVVREREIHIWCEVAKI